MEQVGAHVAGHNTGTIGVCLIGGHGSSETDRFDQHFTAHQDKALRVLLADLKRKFPGVVKITGHNQYAAKACPGFNVGAWYLSAKPVTDSKPPKTDHKPITPGVTQNPNQPKHWMTGLLAFLAALFGRK